MSGKFGIVRAEGKDAGTPRIIFSGKGGSGKSTVMGAFTYYLLEVEMTPRRVLIVDADPAMTTGQISALASSIVPPMSIGDMADKLREGDYVSAIASGKAKDKVDFVLQQLKDRAIGRGKYTNQVGVTHEVHFIRIGQHKNNRCMCAFNAVLNGVLGVLLTSKQYDYILIDREAGQEHINRSVYGRPNDIVVAVANLSAPYMKVAETVIETHRGVQMSALGRVEAKDILVINMRYPRDDDEVNEMLEKLLDKFPSLKELPLVTFPFVAAAQVQIEPLTWEDYSNNPKVVSSLSAIYDWIKRDK